MHLGFVSYEYPPDTGQGGIATYVKQVTELLSARGVEIDVVVASPTRTGALLLAPTLRLYFVNCNSREEFIRQSPETLASIHAKFPFDGVECPEYGAEARFIREKLPQVKLWVKLHTPSYLVKRLNDRYYDQRIWRRIKKTWKPYRKETDPEFLALRKADRMLAPCESMRQIAIKDWALPPDRVQTVPNPYKAGEAFAQIELPNGSPTVIYAGRLETRKGVWNLAKAIPMVLQQMPEARFIFLGKDSRGPLRQQSMKKLLLSELGAYADRVEFIDAVPLEEVPRVMARASIAVFPSLWENFPNVCLEAMAAGRAVVASKEGGMVDMLMSSDGGLFVDPEEPNEIANGLLTLLRDPQRVRAMGERNRTRALEYYGNTLVGELFDVYRTLSFD
jgi:glycogen(starch) synthase